MKVNDEMLMALVDGELDPAAAEVVRNAVTRNAALARRANEFRSARQWSKDAFADILREPVPEWLVSAVLGKPSTVVPLRRRLLPNRPLALAASIAILFGAAGYWAGRQQAPRDFALLGTGAVAQALGETSSGRTRTITLGRGEARLETQAAYRVDGGLCRSFTLSDSAQAWRGVGCVRGGPWTIEIAAPAPTENYTPASTAAAASIDAFLDAAGASEALSSEEEEAAARTTR